MTEESKIEVKLVNNFEFKPYQKDAVDSITAAAVRGAQARAQSDFIRKMIANSRYGKFASGDLVPPDKSKPMLLDFNLYPTHLRMRDLYPHTVPSNTTLQMLGRTLREPLIPALDVPEAPTAPEPAVEPESASVQMLRKLLDDRRKELQREKAHKAETLEEIEDLKAALASEEEDLAQHERHIAAAQESIDQVLADIKALGGRDESVPEA